MPINKHSYNFNCAGCKEPIEIGSMYFVIDGFAYCNSCSNSAEFTMNDATMSD